MSRIQTLNSLRYFFDVDALAERAPQIPSNMEAEQGLLAALPSGTIILAFDPPFTRFTEAAS
jgi:hypothetical protein